MHRVSLEALAVYLVADADLYLIDRREHVEERDGEVRDPVERRRPLDGGQVEPSHPPGPARRGAVLAPDLSYGLGGLGRRAPWASARRRPSWYRLWSPRSRTRRCAEVCRSPLSPPPRGVGGGHERVGPVVVVEQRRLPALEQHPLSALQGRPQDGSRVRDHRLYEVLEGE